MSRFRKLNPWKDAAPRWWQIIGCTFTAIIGTVIAYCVVLPVAVLCLAIALALKGLHRAWTRP